MPRKARIDAPGALHHIIIRGIERKAIFKDAEDYENFLDRLGKVLHESATPCYAWALLPNHGHLLLRTGIAPLSGVMRRVLTGYAQQFNRRHRRHGHLYQNRYKSFLCEEEPYFLELVRYIHLNPLRAGVVKDLDELERMSTAGHGAIMGRTTRTWQDVGYVLEIFHKDVSQARKAYRLYVSQGIGRGKRPDLTGGGLIRSAGGWMALKNGDPRVSSDERILGSSQFVDSVLKRADEEYDKRARRGGFTIDRLIGQVGERCGADPSLIKGPAKQRDASRAKGIVSYLASRLLSMTGTAIASALNLTPSAVCKLARKGRDDPLSKEIEDLVLADR
jgi:REP element-mobilizing transposase RayT